MSINKIFSFFLFTIGIGLIAVGACGNLVLGYIPGIGEMNAWSIIWRIGLGLLLIILAVVLNNLVSSVKPPEF